MSYSVYSGRRRRRATLVTLLCLAAIALAPSLGAGLKYWVMNIHFDRTVEGKLKQAADANTIKLARQKRSEAVEGIESGGKTSGRSHILYYTPAADVGFWYENLSDALAELKRFPEEADSLTTSNQLMKLRETILDESGSGAPTVTVPNNIVTYPHQVWWAIVPLLCIGWIVIVVVTAFYLWEWD